MPEGHSVHRIARQFERNFVGRAVHASSPQGRFAEGAAVLDARTATDRYLGDADHSRYWSNLLPKLSDHFQVARDLFGPRIRQSRWLKANR